MEQGTTSSNAHASESRYEAAVDWLERLDKHDLSEAELHAWLAWFGASDQNRRAFEELQTLVGRLRALPPELREEMHRRTLSVQPSVQRDHVSRRNAVWAVAASLVGAVLAVSVWWWNFRDSPAIFYSAPVDQHRTVQLNDGSALVLGSNSTASVQYTSAQRIVDVERGEAYFEVQHDPERPFVVRAGAVRVTAIGTAFNVRRRSDEVSVTVTQGKVEVLREAQAELQDESRSDVSSRVSTRPSPDKLMRIAVGQRIVIPVSYVASRTAGSTDAQRSTWQDDRIQFVNSSLRDVLAMVNRVAKVPIVIDDPRVADLTYSGTIMREHVDEWIASLPRIYPLQAVRLQDGGVTLVTRTESDSER